MSIYLDNGRQGFVYAVTNPHMPGLVKIGATRKHPLDRTRELGAGTGVPAAMRLEYFHDFADCFQAERMAHERFADQRVNDSREFFRVDLDEVIRFIAGLCNSSVYREAALESAGVIGGERKTAASTVPTPFAELFATFPDDGSARALTADERAKCRALEASLR